MEVLDFAGPFEVFSVANQLKAYQLLTLQVASVTDERIVRAKNGLTIVADTSLAAVFETDMLIIPGGDGSKALLENTEAMQDISRLNGHAKLTWSVCSGARILAALGVLDRQPFTTHHLVIEDVQKLTKNGFFVDKRFVKTGKYATAAGVSAGIDLALHMLLALTDSHFVKQVARYMEYPYIEHESY
ncbi:ThiJ/PfpI domain-containing protein [Nitritalea halalkaliphila LW7]|uniref:ThiJ/PfpI domain-containing protein n=2 Tax=Nitritalea TaxID=1187887 RepID=I5CAH9_9BACT|nr:ThiJ/PfpI domain-containing protein [Nitritalea halalkaliphila LW7]